MSIHTIIGIKMRLIYSVTKTNKSVKYIVERRIRVQVKMTPKEPFETNLQLGNQTISTIYTNA